MAGPDGRGYKPPIEGPHRGCIFLTDLPEAPAEQSQAEQNARSGLIVGVACYVVWGFLPLLFRALVDVNSTTIVANRTVWTLVVVGLILYARRRLPEVAAALRNAATLRSMAISSVLLGGNWLLFVWSVETGQVLEATFGYFINPLVNIAIGMVLLGERQNRWQTVSIVVAAVAIALQGAGLGRFPFIALGLALSFGFYGFFRKTAKVGSATGLFVETLVLVPVALAYLGYTFIRDGGIGLHADPAHLLLLMATGPATATPLLLFAYAVQRLRLTTVGMLQYIAPSITFVIAITLFGEPLNGVRLLSFGLIWLSLVIYTTDSVVRRGRVPA
ncbi:MAG: EamA family transporter RarD [Devosia sp.]